MVGLQKNGVEKQLTCKEECPEWKIRNKDIQFNANSNFFFEVVLPASEIFLISPGKNRGTTMIQRIQTIYLAIAAIACLVLYFFPIANFYNEIEGNYKLFICHIKYMDPDPKHHFGVLFSMPAIVLSLVSVIFSISTIFLYKKRWLQIRLISFNVLTLVVLILVLFFFYTAQMKTITGADPEYSYPGMLLPVLSLVMLILANRAIRKDDQRVKSADRLR